MPKPPAWNWDDIRCFLAVLREGSSLRAAEKLGVNQTTVARRIAALEAALDVALFHRTASGYEPTQAALSLREAAEALEAAGDRFAALAETQARGTNRVLRVSASTFFADAIAAAVARFHQSAPGVLVEVDYTDEVRDLCAGQADLAFRGGFAPEGKGLIVRQLWKEVSGFYCTAAYASRAGMPDRANIARHAIVMLSGKALDLAFAGGLGSSVAQVVNSLEGLIAAIRSGAFVGAVPDTFARTMPDLIKCFDVPELPLGAWLVFPERWRDDRAHRQLRDLLAQELIDRVKNAPQRL